jgi:polyisoprenoid-binding protein YceI
MKRLFALTAVVVLSLVALAPALAAPKVYEIDTTHSSVGFKIRHIVSRVPGAFNEFQGEITYDEADPTQSKVSAEIDVKSLDTASGNRDEHLKSPDFFDAEKFPKISFVSKSVQAKGKDAFAVAGDLTMHGVTKPVTLDVKYLGALGTKAGFEAKTTVNRMDFGVAWNRAIEGGGAVLGDEVEITLLIEANDKVAAMERRRERKAGAPPAAPPAPPPAAPPAPPPAAPPTPPPAAPPKPPPAAPPAPPK